MAFSKLDQNLLTRVVRRLLLAATAQEVLLSRALAVGDIKAAKEIRAEAARIHRDARELDELRERVERAVVVRPLVEDPTRG